MSGLMLAVVVLLNFGISWWNARAVGSAWAETKHTGGWARLVAWSGAVMSAAGFTWCYTLIMAIIAGTITHVPEGKTVAEPYLSAEYVRALCELGYVFIIVPILGSGIIITLHSWREAFKRRTLGSGAVAGWNTFAQIHNTWSAVSEMPGVIKHLTGVFDGDKDNKFRIILILAVLALFGGILSTFFIARSAMQSAAYDARYDLNERRMSRPA